MIECRVYTLRNILDSESLARRADEVWCGMAAFGDLAWRHPDGV